MCFGNRDLPAAELGEELLQSIQVEVVPQAGAPGLQQEGKLRVTANSVQQGLGTPAHKPEGHTAPEVRARKEQGPSGVLPKAGAEVAALLQAQPQKLFELRSPGPCLPNHQGQQLSDVQFLRGHDHETVIIREDLEPAA